MPAVLKRRVVMLALAAAVTSADLAAKAWADAALPGAPVEAGLLDLRLAHNAGVAFSLAAEAPAWTVLAFTAAVTTAVAVLVWRTAPTAGRLWRIALAVVLGGAAANLADRAADGVVTDYLATTWWPTFNLADVAITVGAVLLIAAGWRADKARPASADGQDEER